MEELKAFALAIVHTLDPTLSGARLQEAADRMVRLYGADPNRFTQDGSWLATTYTAPANSN